MTTEVERYTGEKPATHVLDLSSPEAQIIQRLDKLIELSTNLVELSVAVLRTMERAR